MKTQRFESTSDKRILTAMITNDLALRQIAPHWQRGGLFRAAWANEVGSWCIDYVKKYGKAPHDRIKDLFRDWSENGADKDLISIVNKFLVSLSDEYEREDPADAEYIKDIAAKCFNKNQLIKLSEQLQDQLEIGSETKALELLQEFRPIRFGVLEGIDVFQDEDAIREALETIEHEVLIRHTGDLGKFMRNQFTRDSFVAFMGPDKRGKSFWLLDSAFRAALQRKRTALFVVGDMSKPQVMRRLITRVCRRPIHPCEIKVPVEIKLSSEPPFACKIRRKVLSFDDRISSENAMEQMSKIVRVKIRSKKAYLRLSVHPSMAVTTSDLVTILKDWEQEDGWIPEVIVIDYADNLAPTRTRLEYREQINHTWAELRQMSQVYHAAVITATQSDAGAYKQMLIRRHNFSDSKKKLAHVTGMLGINVSDEEKAKSVTRLNWIQVRDAEFTETDVVHVAGCLSFAHPAVLSHWRQA